jgi:hypothetical protein
MPEIETGMVVRSIHGKFYLCVVNNDYEWVLYRLQKGEQGSVGLVFEGQVCAAKNDRHIRDFGITDVYYDRHVTRHGQHRPWLPPSVIIALVESGGTDVRCAHWHRPEPKKEAVREMTVDEISKALGYEVKVVGNEKADD